ncbi:tellurite resistance/C4-dicarboxylate transporter family protein [Glutamicibacter arilaitensis]|uniref:tellurite resistance/C4-dicarboxylate transporter family protein n=1 Tax=Glutamicibacter arilaitensis TaxID=256701 RepID=UPI00384B2C4D
MNPELRDIRSRFTRWVATLAPSVFSSVMATGIVGMGLVLSGFSALGQAFCILASFMFLGLLVVLMLRVVRYPSAVQIDMLNPAVGFGFFTVVAASNVLALALAVLNLPGAAVTALIFGSLIWLVITYAIPAGLVLHERPEPALTHANGSWFLWVVATQSVAGGLAHNTSLGSWTAMFSLAIWLLGCALYLLTATLVTVRMIRYPNRAETLSPTYWIFMGSTAISVLTGSQLLGLANRGEIPNWLQANIAFTTLALLAIGLWFIPMLLVFGFWRHIIHRHPLSYETSLWAIVFPLGMLAASCLSLGSIPDFSALFILGQFVIWVAVAAWVGTTALWVARIRYPA